MLACQRPEVSGKTLGGGRRRLVEQPACLCLVKVRVNNSDHQNPNFFLSQQKSKPLERDQVRISYHDKIDAVGEKIKIDEKMRKR